VKTIRGFSQIVSQSRYPLLAPLQQALNSACYEYVHVSSKSTSNVVVVSKLQSANVIGFQLRQKVVRQIW